MRYLVDVLLLDSLLAVDHLARGVEDIYFVSLRAQTLQKKAFFKHLVENP